MSRHTPRAQSRLAISHRPVLTRLAPALFPYFPGRLGALCDMNDHTTSRHKPHRPDQAAPRRARRHGGPVLTYLPLLGLLIGALWQTAKAQQPPTTTATTRPATTSPATTSLKPPTTTPATATAPVPPPAPKAVALSFAGAIDRADQAAAKSLVVPGDTHVRWTESTIKLAASLKKLDAAAIAKFGEPGRRVSQNALGMPDSFAALQQAQEKIEGDRATLALPGAPTPVLSLRRSANGAWLIDAPIPEADLPRQHRLYAALIEAAERTTTEIAAGAYPNPDHAAAAFARRVLRARIRTA